MPFADHWTSRPRNGKVRENNNGSPEEVRCRGWGREHPSFHSSSAKDEFRGSEGSSRMAEDHRELKHPVSDDMFPDVSIVCSNPIPVMQYRSTERYAVRDQSSILPVAFYSLQRHLSTA